VSDLCLPAAGPAKTEKQYTLASFFKPSAKALAVQPEAKGRGRPLSAAMQKAVAEVASAEYAEAVEAERLRKVALVRLQANRGGRPPGLQSRRQKERPVALQATLAKQLVEDSAGFASLQDLFRAKAKSWGWLYTEVKRVWSRREALLEVQRKRKTSLRPDLYTSRRGCHRKYQAKRYRGYRLPGAGRKSKLSQELATLRSWFEEQRAYGHSVSRPVLLDRWRLMLRETSERYKALAQEEQDKSSAAALLQRAAEAEKQLRTLSDERAAALRVRRLAESLGARNLVPDLTTKLSTEEEEVRAALTYQGLDRALWLACFAPLDLLGRQASALPGLCEASGLCLFGSDSALDSQWF
jgi:hypothetical protein